MCMCAMEESSMVNKVYCCVIVCVYLYRVYGVCPLETIGDFYGPFDPRDWILMVPCVP